MVAVGRLARRCALLALLVAPLARGQKVDRAAGKKCERGRGYCKQWTDHRVNPYSQRGPSGHWECVYGQAAVGYPDATTNGALPNGYAMFTTRQNLTDLVRNVEEEPGSEWWDSNTRNGKCRDCGCECDVVRALPCAFCSSLGAGLGAGSDPPLGLRVGCGCQLFQEYKCACVSAETAEWGNQQGLSTLYVFTIVSVVVFVCCLFFSLPLFLQIGDEQEFCRELLEERERNIAGSKKPIANPLLNEDKDDATASEGAIGNPLENQTEMEAACNVTVTDVTPGTTVDVVIPDGAESGRQFVVDPDGPEGPLAPILVSVPDGKGPGDTVPVDVPGPMGKNARITVAVPYVSMQGLMLVLSKMPGPLGGPRVKIPGALGRKPSPEFDPPPGHDSAKEYEEGPWDCWKAYPLMPDEDLEKVADSKRQLYGKYMVKPCCGLCIASVFLILCLLAQPQDGQYYVGCPILGQTLGMEADHP